MSEVVPRWAVTVVAAVLAGGGGVLGGRMIPQAQADLELRFERLTADVAAARREASDAHVEIDRRRPLIDQIVTSGAMQLEILKRTDERLEKIEEILGRRR